MITSYTLHSNKREKEKIDREQMKQMFFTFSVMDDTDLLY